MLLAHHGSARYCTASGIGPPPPGGNMQYYSDSRLLIWFPSYYTHHTASNSPPRERPSTIIDDTLHTGYRAAARAGFRRPHRRTESPAAASGGCHRVARFTGYKIRLEWARYDHTEGSYGGLKRTMSGGSNRPSLLLRFTFSDLACECMYEDRIVVC